MRVRPSRVRRLRVRKAIGNAALAGVVLAATGAYLAVQKNVTLVLEGQPQAVRTMSSSVGELLDAEGISLDVSSGDLVIPSEGTPLVDGMTVFVDRDYESAITGWTPPDVGVWVVDGVNGPGAMLSARHTEDWFSAGAPVGQRTVTAAHVVVMGKDHDVLTNAGSVGELLSAMGIEPDRNDRVRPSPSAPLTPGRSIRYDQIEHRIKELRLPIPYTTFTEYSDRLRAGQARLVSPGVDGLLLERYRLKLVNGRVVVRDLLGREVLREAIAANRVVGRDSQVHGSQVGEASWYSFAPGNGFTAAHPWLAFGTVVTVTNLANGRTVQVVINDRGPFGGRAIDLSDQAFARLAPLSQGVCQVRLTW
jgi:uncharacterized protein YabE (DUF348 family)